MLRSLVGSEMCIRDSCYVSTKPLFKPKDIGLLFYAPNNTWLKTMINVAGTMNLEWVIKNFFDIKPSIIISSMFVFAPRMVESSLLGTSEPLFLFLGISSLSLFISDNRKNLFLSFALIGLFTSVRYEGILLLIPFTIIYFYKNKKTFQNIKTYFILIGICSLILIPFVSLRMELTDQDGVFSHVISGPLYYQTAIAAEPEIGLEHFFQKGILNLSL